MVRSPHRLPRRLRRRRRRRPAWPDRRLSSSRAMTPADPDADRALEDLRMRRAAGDLSGSLAVATAAIASNDEPPPRLLLERGRLLELLADVGGADDDLRRALDLGRAADPSTAV